MSTTRVHQGCEAASAWCTVLGSPRRSMCRPWPGCRRTHEGHCCRARHTRWCMVRVVDSRPATREPAGKQAASLWLRQSTAVTVVGLSSCKRPAAAQPLADLQPSCAQSQPGPSCQGDRPAARPSQHIAVGWAGGMTVSAAAECKPDVGTAQRDGRCAAAWHNAAK